MIILLLKFISHNCMNKWHYFCPLEVTWRSWKIVDVCTTPVTARDMRHRFDPWVRKIPWRRAWQSSPVFLPGESLGQRSLMGYSPWDCKELDMTKVAEYAHMWTVAHQAPLSKKRILEWVAMPSSRGLLLWVQVNH